MAATHKLDTTIETAFLRQQPMDGGGILEVKGNFGSRKNYPQGTGNEQINEGWFDSRSLAVGTEELDLTSLTQKDADGNNLRTGITFQKARWFYIKNTTALSSTGHLLIGGAAANAWEGGGAPINGAGDKIRLNPGAELAIRIPTGGTVSGTSKALKVESVTADQTYDIEIAGLAT